MFLIFVCIDNRDDIFPLINGLEYNLTNFGLVYQFIKEYELKIR